MYDIRINSIIGHSYAVTSEDGNKIYNHIKILLNDKQKELVLRDRKIFILFHNIDIVCTDFLHSAIGRLYGEFEWDLLEKRVVIVTTSKDDEELIYKIIENAKNYYRNKVVN